MAEVSIRVENYTADVLAELGKAVEATLEDIGLTAEGYAIMQCPVDTGNLRNSITHQVDVNEKQVVVGTPVEYGIYVEMGTGVYAVEGGRQTPWVYMDSEGEFHRTSGMKPRPFVKPALEDHIEEYKSIIEEHLK